MIKTINFFLKIMINIKIITFNINATGLQIQIFNSF